MPACPYCSSSDLTRDGHDQRGRTVYACRACGRHATSESTSLVDETYVKILGKWHYLYRGVDLDGQVPDCWLSATRDLPAAEVFFRRAIASTGCTPEHIVTDKATFYPSAIRTGASHAKHTA